MPYVDRDGSGNISGEYGASQYEGQEFVAEDAPEWVADELAAAKVALMAEVDAERDGRIAATGVSVTLSGARTFIVQTRNLEDKVDLLGMGTIIELLDAATPGSTLDFRDVAGVDWPLNLADVNSLLSQVGDAQQQYIAVAWAHKDAISALTTVAEVAAYDISVGWPVLSPG